MKSMSKCCGKRWIPASHSNNGWMKLAIVPLRSISMNIEKCRREAQI
jgi:hypothetical protein